MAMYCPDDSRLGAVAIGRNEGARLRDCLGSLVCDCKHVVYVDSGSSDDSLAIAHEFGVETVTLDTSIGFTAARARNAGLQRLLEIEPDVELVQFVDGDCRVVDGWIESAAAFLRSHNDVAIVCGRRREREPQRNWYHRLADMEWNSLPGDANSCGGDALMRVRALREVGGYRESLIAGEEPELCVRLRKRGWKTWRLEHEMTLHDIQMTSFSQWWRRAVRAGHAYTEGAALHCSVHDCFRLRKVCSIWSWAVLPLVMLSLARTTHGYSMLAMLVLYLWLLVKIARYRGSTYRDTVPNASLYAVACVVANWPQAIGSLTYLWNWLRGKRSTLIEYGTHASGRPA